MLTYVTKRLLHMIPIVGGVVLLMFVLFNVVGGSPASVVLGKNASAAALEEYDEQRGFNKPLIAGHWVATRAFADLSFETAPSGAWEVAGQVERGAETAGEAGRLVLRAPATVAIPLAFAPHAGTGYRWRAWYRLSPGGAARLSCASAPPGPPGAGAFKAGAGWRKGVFDCRTGANATQRDFVIEVERGVLELRGLTLRRRVANAFDSQLVFYVRQLLRCDLGVSHETNQKVAAILRAGVGPSLCLALPIFVGNLVVSIVLALVCAFFRDRLADRLLVVAATALMSVNYVVWVIAGQYLLAYRLGWFPIWGFESWRYLALPVLIGVATGVGRDLRFYRTFMLDEMYKDYVRAAAARGVSRTRILFRHVLPNAMVPVVTNVSMALPFLFTGSLLLESFFGIPGLGGVSINAINSGDLDVVRAVVLLGALAYVVINLATDLLYAWVDPRVRLTAEE